ncbi:HDOD domain-containing protein [Lentisphaerota bacterium WC36G]|nr:HDOD domain-containing protein [Lentisphaerae bacterium WC36]
MINTEIDENYSKDILLAQAFERIQEENIASLSHLMNDIIEIINCNQTNAQDLTVYIQRDPALSARVLREANSMQNYSSKRISNIVEAVIWLGFDTIKELALSQRTVEAFDGSELDKNHFSRNQLWKHSVGVATMAKLIMRMEFADSGDFIYVAGLLHDFGLLIIDQVFPEKVQRILELMENKDAHILKVTEQVFGFNHIELTNMLIDSWNFPKELKMLVNHSFNPFLIEEDLRREAMVLTIADHFCTVHEGNFGIGPGYAADNYIVSKCLKELKIYQYTARSIMDEFKKKIKSNDFR